MGKPEKSIRFRPTYRDGLNIQYKLKDRGLSLVKIASGLEIDPSLVTRVVFGRRHSARVEAEIARLLGAADWNAVVLEARSAVTGKSVTAIIKERNRQQAERDKAAMESFGANMSAELAARKRRAG
jgi:transcriptional regulator with XRE-family HTH domain